MNESDLARSNTVREPHVRVSWTDSTRVTALGAEGSIGRQAVVSRMAGMAQAMETDPASDARGMRRETARQSVADWVNVSRRNDGGYGCCQLQPHNAGDRRIPRLPRHMRDGDWRTRTQWNRTRHL